MVRKDNCYSLSTLMIYLYKWKHGGGYV